MTSYKAAFGASILALSLCSQSFAQSTSVLAGADVCAPSERFWSKFKKVNKGRALKKTKIFWEKKKLPKPPSAELEKLKSTLRRGDTRGLYYKKIVGYSITSAKVTGQRDGRRVYLSVSNGMEQAKFNYYRAYGGGSAKPFDHSKVMFQIGEESYEIPVRTTSKSGGCRWTTRTTGPKGHKMTHNVHVCNPSYATSTFDIPADVIQKIGAQDPSKPFPIYFVAKDGEKYACPLYVPPLEFWGFMETWNKAKKEFEEKQ